jgi:hypothetical protein
MGRQKILWGITHPAPPLATALVPNPNPLLRVFFRLRFNTRATSPSIANDNNHLNYVVKFYDVKFS